MPRRPGNGALVFHNKAGRTLGAGTGHMFDAHKLKIKVDVFPAVSIGEIPPTEHSVTDPTPIRGSILSSSQSALQVGQSRSFHGGRLSADRDFYVVESHHGVKFNLALEWPPRNPDKL